MGDRWIVGIDGSDESCTALGWALHHSIGRDVEIVAAHVDHAPVGSRLVGAVTGRGGTHPATAELEALVSTVAAGRPVVHDVVTGSPGHALVQAAGDAGLLVVGRHGAGGWRHALGSVGRYCVTHSPTPTVVVPPGWSEQPTRRVVVGFDGSDQAAAALAWACSFFDDDIDLRALVAIEVAPWLQEDIVRARLGEELQAEERRLRDLLADADPAGRARPEVTVKGARAALARAAGTADLVVVGAHGAGRIGTALMGSVSTWILDGSPTPVAVVPHHPAGARPPAAQEGID